MAPKQLFLRNQDLVKASLAITKSDTFELLLTYAKAEFASRNPNNEQMTGANEFVRTLINMTESGDIAVDFPQPGLEHNLDVKRKELSNPDLAKK